MIITAEVSKHGVNTIPEVELLFLKELELINLELKFATKKIHPQINLPFNF